MPVDRATAERVQAVLAARLGEEAAAAAAERWTTQYAMQPGGGVVRFVQELATRHTMEPTVRQRLRMELFQAIYHEEAQAVAEGGGGGRAAPAPRQPAEEPPQRTAPRSPGQQVCAALLVSMLGQARQSERAQMLAMLAEYVGQSGVLPRPLVDAFREWEGQGDPPVSDTDEGLQAMVHAGYLALCEVFGPADADRLLRRCVQRVDGMAAAVEYPPSRLL